MYRLLLAFDIVLVTVALLHLPYAYYELVRVVSCPILLYGTRLSYLFKKNYAAWVFGTLSVLYNPVLKVHLQRESWELVNIATIIFLGVIIWKLPSWEKINNGSSVKQKSSHEGSD